MARRKSVPQSEANRLKKRRQNDIKLDRKIHALQNTDIALIPKAPFSRLVKETMQLYKTDFRMSVAALVNTLMFFPVMLFRFVVDRSGVIFSGCHSGIMRILSNISVQRCVLADLSSKTRHFGSVRHSDGVAYSRRSTKMNGNVVVVGRRFGFSFCFAVVYF